MNEKLKSFLKGINKGRLYKAQKIVAEKIGVSDVTVSKWCSGKMQPSDDNIIKMAKVFKKTEKEIRSIFLESSEDSFDVSNNALLNKFADAKEVEILKQKVKNLELEIELIKAKR